MRLGIAQGGGQQFVQRLGRLMPEPPEQPRPTAQRPQRLGQQCMRRDVIGAGEQLAQEIGGGCAGHILTRLQRLPQ